MVGTGTGVTVCPWSAPGIGIGIGVVDRPAEDEAEVAGGRGCGGAEGPWPGGEGFSGWFCERAERNVMEGDG